MHLRSSIWVRSIPKAIGALQRALSFLEAISVDYGLIAEGRNRTGGEGAARMADYHSSCANTGMRNSNSAAIKVSNTPAIQLKEFTPSMSSSPPTHAVPAIFLHLASPVWAPLSNSSSSSSSNSRVERLCKCCLHSATPLLSHGDEKPPAHLHWMD